MLVARVAADVRRSAARYREAAPDGRGWVSLVMAMYAGDAVRSELRNEL
jgi:hypothetical protein